MEITKPRVSRTTPPQGQGHWPAWAWVRMHVDVPPPPPNDEPRPPSPPPVPPPPTPPEITEPTLPGQNEPVREPSEANPSTLRVSPP